jgi:hypothetical protein
LSGSSRQGRLPGTLPGRTSRSILRFVRGGGVVAQSMGGLAYHLHDANALVQGLTRKGVRVEFVKEHQLFIGGDSPMANRMLSVMGALACQASLEPSLPFTGAKLLRIQTPPPSSFDGLPGSGSHSQVRSAGHI